MEKAIAVLCILVLGVTAVDGVVEITGVDVPGFKDPSKTDGEGVWSEVKTVTMPENKIREIVQYDMIMRVELYFENKTSGEWTYWALDVSGQQLIKITQTITMIDGYGADHDCLQTERDVSAQFTVYLDDSDGEQVTSDGEFDAQREEYVDLLEEITVKIDTNANISVDELPSTNIPLSFRGFSRSYFDPRAPDEETLEEGIYGEGQTITVGDTGEWVDETGWTELTYEWKAERAKVIAGYEPILINISTDFGNEDFSVPFNSFFIFFFFFHFFPSLKFI